MWYMSLGEKPTMTSPNVNSLIFALYTDKSDSESNSYLPLKWTEVIQNTITCIQTMYLESIQDKGIFTSNYNNTETYIVVFLCNIFLYYS